MRKGLNIFIFVSLVLVLSVSLVSANTFSDFFNGFFDDNQANLSPSTKTIDECDDDSDCYRTEVCYDGDYGDYCVECYKDGFYYEGCSLGETCVRPSGDPYSWYCSSGDDECTPQCDGKQCGSDGCGGSCGGCSTGLHCEYNTGQCQGCQPSTCEEIGRECGQWENGCGGTLNCGNSCPRGYSCNYGSGQCEIDNGGFICNPGEVKGCRGKTEDPTDFRVCKDSGLGYKTDYCDPGYICNMGSCVPENIMCSKAENDDQICETPKDCPVGRDVAVPGVPTTYKVGCLPDENKCAEIEGTDVDDKYKGKSCPNTGEVCCLKVASDSGGDDDKCIEKGYYDRITVDEKEVDRYTTCKNECGGDNEKTVSGKICDNEGSVCCATPYEDGRKGLCIKEGEYTPKAGKNYECITEVRLRKGPEEICRKDRGGVPVPRDKNCAKLIFGVPSPVDRVSVCCEY